MLLMHSVYAIYELACTCIAWYKITDSGEILTLASDLPKLLKSKKIEGCRI